MPGSNENEDVLKCLHQCAESLQIPAVANSVSSGTEMLIDSKGSVVKVDGKKAKDVASMVNSTLTPIYHFNIINILKEMKISTCKIYLNFFTSRFNESHI